MPIRYTLAPITDYMEELQAEAFDDAVTAIVGALDLLSDEEFTTGVVAQSMRFGISMPTGKPVTTYSTNRRSTLRTNTLRLDIGAEPDMLDFFSYDILYDDIGGQVPAVFANLIRDNLSINTEEDAEIGFNMDFIDGVYYLRRDGINLEFKPFGFGNDLNVGKIAIFANGVIPTDRLLHFSYLSVTNLPGNSDYVSGLVHPQGYPLNAQFGIDPGYEVRQLSDSEYHIVFTEEFSANRPTILVFPQWLPFESAQVPTTSGQVAIATNDISKNGFKVTAGAQTTELLFCDTGTGLEINPVEEETDQFLGFSFLAIDQELSNPGLVHGNIGVNPTSGVIDNQSGQGFNATSTLVETTVKYDPLFDDGEDGVDVPAFGGGVLVEFDEEFLDIPSVIATPLTNIAISDFRINTCDGIDNTWFGQILEIILSDQINDNVLLFTEPVVVVEHVTRKQALIKVGVINTIQGLSLDIFNLVVAAANLQGINLGPIVGNQFRFYTPVSFSFVAVGPVKLEEEA